MATDATIHDTIRRLVGEERALRAAHLGDPAAVGRRLAELEAQLDQCWDLLRQRGALRAVGRNPETAVVRSALRIQSYRK